MTFLRFAPTRVVVGVRICDRFILKTSEADAGIRAKYLQPTLALAPCDADICMGNGGEENVMVSRSASCVLSLAHTQGLAVTVILRWR